MQTQKIFNTHRLYITPLSPIHIGCGEDLEPTNFVVDDEKRVLYSMDPSRAVLTPEQRRELLAKAKEFSLTSIYSFYKKNFETFKPWAKAIIPIDDGIYHNIIAVTSGKNIRKASTERTSYRHIDGYDQPYIPGSSLKGCIHTALIERLNAGQYQSANADKNARLDDLLFGGKMNLSPLRYLSIGDLTCTNPLVFTRAIIAERIKKFNFEDTGIKTGIEVIDLAQYRAFEGSLTIRPCHGLRGEPNPNVCYKSIEEIVKDLNRYSLPRFKKELANWKKDVQWHRSVDNLLFVLKPLFDSGKIALIRLGKNGGAETKTITGDSLPQIKNRQKNCYQQESLTAFVGKTENHIRPFGWALVEIDAKEDNANLKQWCETVRAQSQFAEFDLVAIKKSFESERDAILVRKEELAKVREEERLKAEAEALAEETKQKALAAMPENQRTVSTLCEAIANSSKPVKPGTPLHQQAMTLIANAYNWNKDDQLFFAQHLRPIAKKKGMYEGKAEKEIKKALNAFEGKS